MTAITIDGQQYAIKAALREGFVIADAGGAFAYAARDPATMTWDWWAGSPTADDAAALKKVIEDNGGFDRTSIDVIKETP